MRRLTVAAWAAALTALVAGCASGPLTDNPVLVRPDPECNVENPVYIPLGPPAYGTVFEKTLDVVSNYFEISYANRYDGRIETFPTIAPGFEQIWKPGSPNCYERLFATMQTLRYRAAVLIQPADDGGFFVQVTVFRELEDVPQPVRATAGAAAFRSDNTVERQFEVIDPAVRDTNWIPLGREVHLEQLILQQLKQCM
ncbi:MAG: hypothetical protein K2R98_03300 [Gemmataceae bacterium]|nr:hypothetical protein [Gemmataceae bacterium]